VLKRHTHGFDLLCNVSHFKEAKSKLIALTKWKMSDEEIPFEEAQRNKLKDSISEAFFEEINSVNKFLKQVVWVTTLGLLKRQLATWRKETRIERCLKSTANAIAAKRLHDEGYYFGKWKRETQEAETA